MGKHATEIVFNTSITTSFQLYIHPRTEMFFQSIVSRQIDIIPNIESCTLKYTHIVQKIFFKTNIECFEGQTRDECISNCYVEEYINVFNEYPSDYFINRTNSSLLFDSKQKNRDKYQIYENCLELCNKNIECFKQHFTTYPIFQQDNYNERKNLFSLFIENSLYSSIKYEIYLKISFEEYLILMSSILSLWFGFSIVMFTDFCEPFITKIINKIHLTNNVINVRIPRTNIQHISVSNIN